MAYAKGILDTLGLAYDEPEEKPEEEVPETDPEEKPEEEVPETDPEVQAAITKVQQKAGLAAETMQYLLAYKYGAELVTKLAAAMK